MRRRLRASFVTIGFALAVLPRHDATAADSPSGAAMVIEPIAVSDVDVAFRQHDFEKGRTLEKWGYAVYAIGAAYDLYTTKRALDAGLQESNPLMGQSDNPRRTLATAATVKIGIALIIGGLTHKSKASTRGAWMLSYGAVQIGAGLANRNATMRARDQAAPPAATVTVSAP